MKKYFHGSNKSGPYFEGWYFKCQTRDGQSLALIPAFHIGENGEQSASIQVVTDKQAWYLDYPASTFAALQDYLHIAVGENHFSDTGLYLDVEQDGLNFLRSRKCKRISSGSPKGANTNGSTL